MSKKPAFQSNVQPRGPWCLDRHALPDGATKGDVSNAIDRVMSAKKRKKRKKVRAGW